MTRTLLTFVAVLALCASTFAGSKDTPAEDRQKAVERAQKAAQLFGEIMGAPDNAIPGDLLDDAWTIAVFPEITKGAFIFGGTGGSGLVSVRDPRTHTWGPPLFVTVGGGSWGAQIGVEQTDLILVGMDKNSGDLFQKGSWKLGAEASATAGPVGRTSQASTDAKLKSGFLSYSRSKGLFAGISLEGAKVNFDKDQNAAVYGPSATAGAILGGSAKPNPDAASIRVYPETLAKYSPSKRG